jgi:hypothetical protein
MKNKDTILLEQAYLKVIARSLKENTNNIPPDLEGEYLIKGAGGGSVKKYGNVAQAVADGHLTYDPETGIFSDMTLKRYKIGKDWRGKPDLVDAIEGSGPSNPTPKPPYRNLPYGSEDETDDEKRAREAEEDMY